MTTSHKRKWESTISRERSLTVTEPLSCDFDGYEGIPCINMQDTLGFMGTQQPSYLPIISVVDSTSINLDEVTPISDDIMPELEYAD